MACTNNRHVWNGVGSTTDTPLMAARCACGAFTLGEIQSIKLLQTESGLLSWALKWLTVGGPRNA